MVQHNFTTSLNLIYFCYLANLSLDNGFLRPFPEVVVVLFKDNAKPTLVTGVRWPPFMNSSTSVWLQLPYGLTTAVQLL